MEWKKEWAYDGGISAGALYNTGAMLADDSHGDTEEDSSMLLVTDTSAEEYGRYLEKLCALGFEKIFENHSKAVASCQLKKGDTLLYVYYTCAAGEVRIIEDRASCGLKDFSYGCESEDSAEIYQYGLYYDPQNQYGSVAVNCEMFYIIRLTDNRLVMIDGGDYRQCSAEALEGMYRFLRRITDTGEGEKIHIAAWYFTHAHSDHMAACVRLLRTYPEAFLLERVMFNFLPYTMKPGDRDILVLKETLREYCPDLQCLKLHNGQVITLANVRFEVLYTHEDAITSKCPGTFPFQDFNSTSVLMKMTTGSGTVMWLGDTNGETEELVLKTVPAELWKSDVVQIAHHCFNFLSGLYPAINADYAMLPNSHYGGHAGANHDKLMDVVNCLASPENLWYEDQTTGFRFQGGKFQVILEEARVGGAHDGVDLYGRHS